jgi:hypothetical protein
VIGEDRAAGQRTGRVGEELLVGALGEPEEDTLAQADEQRPERGDQTLRLLRRHDAATV